jgi:hypothetical protein
VKKSLVWLLGLGLLHGCTVVYTKPDAVPQQPASQPPPAQPSKPKAITVSQSIQLCQDIQENPDLAVGCTFKYIDGKATLFFKFPTLNEATEAWPIITERHAGPFCNGTNAVNRQARVVVVLHDPKMARMYTCETNRWTEWSSYDQGRSQPNDRY